ncbi:Quinol monooxygenase YgiN [Altererythrobacter xiamenensis]|uniref:Quinol monooxygenase YgiN n=1 Tax=Altererythrobacter xiamenensis TaxID=1316679 RepID=A0A1Y6FME2_9SPHN|nr:putative quinol monooxygenase [Altererythrobacter xiamenensis]SMQ73563.1 Quinol monooxygenase YgiN [Altererythrobacter xiamenensis]
MILVVGTVRIADGGFEKAAEAMEKNIKATRAEDGCIRYAYARDVLDPQVMHVSEAWRDMDALKAHGKSAHMAEWGKAIASIGASERDLRIYDTDEGTPI